MESTNVEEKEHFSYVSKNAKIETTNPSDKSEKLLGMMQTSQRLDRFLNWLYGILTVIVLLLLLYHFNVKIDATILAAISGTGLLSAGSDWFKNIKEKSDKTQ